MSARSPRSPSTKLLPARVPAAWRASAGTSSRGAIAALAVLWSVVTAATFAASGCYGHNCDGVATNFGQRPGEGQLVDEDTWQSGPIDGPWLPFPKRQTYFFDLNALGVDRVPAFVIPYVSAQSDPLHEGGNQTIAGGNLAEISGVDKGRVTVHNGTCADYFLRVVVAAPPRAGGGPNTNDGPDETPDDSDAGPDGADATVEDAAVEDASDTDT